MADLLELFKSKKTSFIFFVNGKRIQDSSIDPRISLAQYLRQTLKLTGTKIGCNEGGCGACTVMVSDMSLKTGTKRAVHHYSVNSCLYPIYMAHGRAITTVEGIGNVLHKNLHPVQERLSKCHGSQCGFCTPGFVMAMYSLLRSNPQPSIEEIDESLQGNLCRCTGYRPILEAYYSFSKESSLSCCKSGGAGGCCKDGNEGGGQGCCKTGGAGGCCKDGNEGGGQGCCKSGGAGGCCKDGNEGGGQGCCKTGGAGGCCKDGNEGGGQGCCKSGGAGGCCKDGNEGGGQGCCKTGGAGGCCKDGNEGGGQGCCKSGGAGGCCKDGNEGGGQGCCKTGLNKQSLTNDTAFKEYDPTQELIFPPELATHDYLHAEFCNGKDNFYWFRPKTLHDALELLKLCPEAKIVAGNSEIGVEQRFKNMEYKNQIDLSAIESMKHWELLDDGVFLGASLSLNSCQTILDVLKKSIKAVHKTRVIDSVLEMIHWFAGKHIRNTATIAGNIATASPISDLNPVWLACNAQLTVVSSRGERILPMNANFFVKYRTTIIEKDEIIKGIKIPFLNENDHFFCYKQAQRREDDIAIVNAAFKIKLEKDAISDITMAFGGMAPTTVMLNVESCNKIKELKWNESLLETVFPLLLKEFALPVGVPGGMERFRQALVLSFFQKFFWDVQRELEGDNVHSKGKKFSTPLKSTQVYQEVAPGQPMEDPLGRPIMHLSGEKHTTGEAIYCDDQAVADCLHMAFVLSKHASAKILSIDPTNALATDGVVSFLGYNDALSVGKNNFGVCGQNLVFAVDEVIWYGQPIGVVVARTPEVAMRAAQKVIVKYEVSEPVITIEDAIAGEKFYDVGPKYISNHRDTSGKPIPIDWLKHSNMIDGSIRIGGQEHFYLETQCCIVIPGEDGELKVISSTQHTSSNQVVVSVRRIGGGFGGKETAANMLAVTCAVAAYKLQKPVRCCLERCDDMVMTGTRHPYFANYRVGYENDGKINAFHSELYSNAGAVIDLSASVLDRALTHIDNVYNISYLESRGHLCHTNIQPSTAFRGFGGPQAMFITESMVEHVAENLGMTPEEVREMNFYNEGGLTPFGMTLDHCNVMRCWTECKLLSNFKQRKAEVDVFNKKNHTIKRGISMIPTKFGIAFGVQHFNQAGALVHIYVDGTVLISHGGMEMGQGLHTKVQQIACRTLGVPLDMVHIQDQSSDKVPNISATAASVGSDLNGMAVKNACEKLIERLSSYKTKNTDGNWVEWINAAYVDCVSLSATGYWSMPSLEQYDFEKGKGRPFLYFVYGVACSEVQIDCLTGDHRVLQTDIVMDVGDSLNPAVDIGQIEGAFIQGYGLFTMEELKVSPKGMVYTRGPGTYKIPSADDAPRNFNVKLLKGSSNKHGVFSSKGIGEPPLFLGASVFFAIKEAIKSARSDKGHSRVFQMDSPATPENIRLSCRDNIIDMIPAIPESEKKRLWLTPL